jgi:hypothetical protein
MKKFKISPSHNNKITVNGLGMIFFKPPSVSGPALTILSTRNEPEFKIAQSALTA